VAAAKCEYGVAKQKNVYVEQAAAIVARTTILSFFALAFVVVELNEKYPRSSTWIGAFIFLVMRPMSMM
jgi:hypothetical protein